MKPAAVSDNAALRALAGAGDGTLCTIVEIDGSYSRRLGAQLAILPDGTMAGSLADGCLEAQLVRDADAAAAAGQARLIRFGRHSLMIDFQLPCGSGIDIVVDPAPDMEALRRVAGSLDQRQPAALPVTAPQMARPFLRQYRPELRLVVLGTGPECEMLSLQAEAFGLTPEWLRPRGKSGGELSLGRTPDLPLDRWTAVVLLFHDHEWEHCLLPWALSSDAFYVGAQGGAAARAHRAEKLLEAGLTAERLGRLRSPIGLIESSRDPSVLALSVLAEVVARYEAMTA